MNLSEEKENNPLEITIILEIIGRPPEHLKESLEEIIKQIKKEKDINVKRYSIKEPAHIKDQENLYSTFAEIEIELSKIYDLFMVVFKYMPAHIEVNSPEKISMLNNEWNIIFNELARKLHEYDEIARLIQIERDVLEKKLRAVLKENKDNKN